MSRQKVDRDMAFSSKEISNNEKRRYVIYSMGFVIGPNQTALTVLAGEYTL
jgi:hypothetical protein